jgi:hypothetical protein
MFCFTGLRTFVGRYSITDSSSSASISPSSFLIGSVNFFFLLSSSSEQYSLNLTSWSIAPRYEIVNAVKITLNSVMYQSSYRV